MRINIGTKLILGFIVIIGMITVLALYSVSIGQKSLEDSVGKSAVYIADVILRNINLNIYNYIEKTQAYSKNFMLQEIVSQSNSKFERIDNVNEYINRREKKWISETEKKAAPLADEITGNELSGNLRHIFLEFYEKKFGYKVFAEVFVTNKFGAVIAQTGKISDYRQDDEVWWKRAREKGIYVSNIEYDESSGTQSISVAVKIEDENGNFSGIIKGVISSFVLIKSAEIYTKKHRTAEINLITEDGKLIYSTRPFRFLEDITGEKFFEKLKKSPGFFTAVEGGKNKLFSYAHSRGYRDLKKMPWILILEHDVNEVMAPVFSLRNRVIVFSAGLILFGIIIALFISRLISKPLEKLTRGAEIIGKGNLDHKIAINRRDEIGDLSTAFNEMTENLKEVTTSRDELEEEIIRRKKIEKKLKRTLKELARSNRELEQFAYVASHDLQEPLRMISSFTQLLEERYGNKLDEDAREFVEYIVDGANRMQQLIQDLLVYSRVTTRGKEFTETDANSALGEARANLNKAIEDSNAVVRNDELPTVMADRMQLVRLFQNLIKNAIEFSGDSAPNIYISAREKGNEWIFSVKDNGIGIEPEYREKIFKIFQQLRDVDKIHGTGIGLSICRRIVERHGGKIWVESEPGEGSTFYFTIPVKGGK